MSINSIFLLWIGGSILAFGLYNVHGQSSITEGGVLGMTLLINHWFNISPAVSGPLMDITCFMVGVYFLGKNFLTRSIIASLSFASAYAVFESFPPILPSLYQYPILASVVGATFVGVAIGICSRTGGATGGDDAIAITINRVTGKKLGIIYFCQDLIVLTLSLTYIPINRIIYSLLTVMISGFLIQQINDFNMKK